MPADEPEGLLDVVDTVMAAVGVPGPWLIERVPVGQSNHVYRVADQRGRAVAVRIGRRAPSRFPAEGAVMRAAAEAGVPVPVVRHVGEVVQGGGVVPVMVTDWVDAPRLADAARSFAAAPSPHLVRSLAQALARTHGVRVGGFGRLDVELSSPYQRFDEWFVDEVHERVTASHDALRNDPVFGSDPHARALLDRGVEVLVDHRAVLATSSQHLAHGDLSPENLLVDLRGSDPTLTVMGSARPIRPGRSSRRCERSPSSSTAGWTTRDERLMTQRVR